MLFSAISALDTSENFGPKIKEKHSMPSLQTESVKEMYVRNHEIT